VIDYGFEERLIERIALREVISAARLDVRQKRVLRCHLHGQTFAEIAENEGRSLQRIREIYKQSVRKIRHRVRADAAGFDKAGFLRHMQGLAQQRDKHEQEYFEAERAELERMLAEELKPAKPSPPPLKPPRPPPVFSVSVTLGASTAPPPISPGPISGWLIERLLDAGEYYQVYNYYRWMLPDQDDA
jgi:hypothetical protein